MLLDKYVLTKGFETLLTGSTNPPANFIKRVTASTAKLDPLLKTLQVRPTPPEGLVQAYLIHIGDKSDANFRKILELKGVRKADQGALVELFQAHRSSPTHATLVQNSPLLTPLSLQSSAQASALGSYNPAQALAGGVPGLQTRFDPSTFGSAIMSAARDGVERMGTSNIAMVRDGTMSPPHGSEGEIRAGMNENLRSLGKFFRRDMSGGMSGLRGTFGGSKANDDNLR